MDLVAREVLPEAKAEENRPQEQSLVGAVFQASAGFPIMAAAWGLVATVLLILAAFSGEVQLALAAFLPLAWAIGSSLFRPESSHLTVTETALKIDHPAVEVPYDQLQIVRWEGRTCHPDDLPFGPGRLTLIHQGGALDLPNLRSESTSVEDLYRFLWSFLTGSGSRHVSPRLARFVSEQEAFYGSDKVFTFAAREHADARPPMRRLQACLCLSGLVGIIWLLLGPAVGAHDGFRVAGWIAALGGPAAAITLWASSLPAVRMGQDLRDASLAVSPGGLALIQGTLEGVMTWDELFAVNGPHTLLGLGPDTALRLRVAGATIAVADVYDRPLVVIRQKVYHCWRAAPRLWY